MAAAQHCLAQYLCCSVVKCLWRHVFAAIVQMTQRRAQAAILHMAVCYTVCERCWEASSCRSPHLTCRKLFISYRG